MNYSHSYHAGGFADVFKHTILITLIKAMLRKENGFCYVDTHAGSGAYDLFSEDAKKNKEFDLGIQKIIHQTQTIPLLSLYAAVVRRINNRLTHSVISTLRYYPGSPAFARYFLRKQDRAILCELHPKEFQLLKTHFNQDESVSVQLMDGYQALKAFLPPKERRGLIFIDPPFERPNEFATILSALSVGLKRFSTGIFCIWYPIKERTIIDRFHQGIKEILQKPFLVTEMTLYPEAGNLLSGCGIVIINPPWQLDKQIGDFLPSLTKQLSPQGTHRIAMSL